MMEMMIDTFFYSTEEYHYYLLLHYTHSFNEMYMASILEQTIWLNGFFLLPIRMLHDVVMNCRFFTISLDVGFFSLYFVHAAFVVAV